MIYDDAYFMQAAINEALKASQQDEVPIGAVIVSQNQIVGRGYNQTQKLHDITAHAEIIAISSAAEYLGSKYLEKCTLYVTIEPCVMCAGALFWAKIDRIVFGASDSKFGSSRYGNLYHPKTVVQKGILSNECSELIKDFFRKKR